MDEQTERRMFEAWIKSTFERSDTIDWCKRKAEGFIDGGDYVSPSVHMRWIGWLARSQSARLADEVNQAYLRGYDAGKSVCSTASGGADGG